ncbi:MAG: hypothetical protein QHH18_07310 [Candidatus Bathyarchaeota archaeon]|jgi:hypothetical protein|nr:hypothetical protein [Candidatus Bathyarchaeota archaeon A05DMB-5]MDH7558389.1 hypothetical protein [Candidatus Bathyarchaeota archaeon]
MDNQTKHAYELAKKTVLSNDLLTQWLIDIEERLRKLESSQSLNVTWEVSKAELAETKIESME